MISQLGWFLEICLVSAEIPHRDRWKTIETSGKPATNVPLSPKKTPKRYVWDMSITWCYINIYIYIHNIIIVIVIIMIIIYYLFIVVITVYTYVYIYKYIHIHREREIILVEIVSVVWGVKQSCLIVAKFVSMHIYIHTYIYIYIHVCNIYFYSTCTISFQFCIAALRMVKFHVSTHPKKSNPSLRLRVGETQSSEMPTVLKCCVDRGSLSYCISRCFGSRCT